MHSLALEVHPSAVIGERLILRFGGIGITIERGATIGSRCTISNQVYVGRDRSSKAATIGDDVYLGVSSKILGDISIGDGAKVGAMSVVTSDVMAGGTVVGGAANPPGQPPDATTSTEPTTRPITWQVVRADLAANDELGGKVSVVVLRFLQAARVAPPLARAALSPVRAACWVWFRLVVSSMIDLRAEIGPGLRLEGIGAGTVVARGAVVGARCSIATQVVIGEPGSSAQPTIEDDVTIGAGAKIVGDVTVRAGSTVPSLRQPA